MMQQLHRLFQDGTAPLGPCCVVLIVRVERAVPVLFEIFSSSEAYLVRLCRLPNKGFFGLSLFER